jgi:hypothetical protein
MAQGIARLPQALTAAEAQLLQGRVAALGAPVVKTG